MSFEELWELVKKNDEALRDFATVIAEENPKCLTTIMTAYRVWQAISRYMILRGSPLTPVNFCQLCDRTGLNGVRVAGSLILLLALGVLKRVKPADADQDSPQVVKLLPVTPDELLERYRELGCPTMSKITPKVLEEKLGKDRAKAILSSERVPERVFGKRWVPPDELPDGGGEEDGGGAL